MDSKRRIGGSVIPKIVGLSRFGTPLDAYMELRGETFSEVEDSEVNEDIDRGNFLEPALREWAAKKLKAEGMVKPPETLTSALSPWFTYSPDGLFHMKDEGPALLEVKAPGPWTVADWGEEMTDQVPDEYAIQGQWGLMVTGRSVCYFAALIGGRLKLFRMVADRELHGVLRSKADEFVQKYVVPGAPPPVEFGDDAYLRRKFPRSNGVYLRFNEMTAGQQALVRDFLNAYVAHKDMEKIVEKEFKPRIKEMLGEHSGVEFSDPLSGFKRIDFESQADRQKIDWSEVAQDLAKYAGQYDKADAEMQYTSSLERHTETVRGNRPLVPRPAKKAKGDE